MKEAKCPKCKGPLRSNDAFTIFSCDYCNRTFTEVIETEAERRRKEELKEKRRLEREEKKKAEEERSLEMIKYLLVVVAIMFIVFMYFAPKIIH